MLGRDRAAVGIHLGIDQGVHGFLLIAQKGFGIRALGRLHVVMQIAVAQMAVVHHACAGKGGLNRCIGFAHKVRDSRHGNRNVVLDVQAFLRLGQRNAFAYMPERAGLGNVLGHHCVEHAAILKCILQQAFQQGAGVGFGVVV